MPAFEPALAYYAVPFFAILTLYVGMRKRKEGHARARFNEAISAGLAEPASLHPKIDPSLCLGCATCARACPEGDVLGIINGKAVLIEAASCIGHGACKAACPNNAISLVFGSEERGIDLPLVDSDFETNVHGIFIAGELGGMGLIRNAIEQGRQALAAIAKRPRTKHREILDVVIVGSGPAGISASLAAIEAGLSFATLEQEQFGGTVAHYPRGKLVMTRPADLPLIGPMPFTEVGKEDLLAFWTKAAEDAGLHIAYGTRVDAINRTAYGFQVETAAGIYLTRHVLLAIGRRGTPRKLGVTGENLPKVVYRLIDAEQYAGQSVLVVGGGDSALEAAASLADAGGSRVVLSYRGAAFARAKSKNRSRVEALAQAGTLIIALNSEIQCITPDAVCVASNGQSHWLKNDAVIVCAGGVLPTEFLKGIGIEIETKYGTA